MQIFTINNKKNFYKPIYLFGAFESFHLGHQSLLQKAFDLKQNDTKRDIVLIYIKDVENLPKNYQKLIFSNVEYRIQQFANMGIPYAIELNFKEISHFDATTFFNSIINTQDEFTLIIGPDAKFGKNGEGNIEWLNTNYPNNYLIIDELSLNNGQKISTSFLKECLVSGEIELVNNLNSYHYGFTAQINQINNNTYTLNYSNNIINIPSGIYAAYLEMGEYTHYVIFAKNLLKNQLMNLDYKLDITSKNKVTIKPLKLIKTIFSNENFEIQEKDLEECKKFFVQINTKS
ncbi:FAD synthase [Mycoplasma sp. 1018B]|uniref:FAD synthase n=1 Tax=Mycoplasma sp. 1018B TaxID=2967302 RepID=UPI00211B830B|nr:hypothetical protein [Mycoplasma sp. 1018B]UUM19279.1 hypothetical protein NPA14_00135 [Mycoplasma sp. 1018B]